MEEGKLVKVNHVPPLARFQVVRCLSFALVVRWSAKMDFVVYCFSLLQMAPVPFFRDTNFQLVACSFNTEVAERIHVFLWFPDVAMFFYVFPMDRVRNTRPQHVRPSPQKLFRDVPPCPTHIRLFPDTEVPASARSTGGSETKERTGRRRSLETEGWKGG